MDKDRDKSYNGSYLYRLNKELSGQAELEPYFLSVAGDGTSPGSSAEVEEALYSQGSVNPDEEESRGEYEQTE